VSSGGIFELIGVNFGSGTVGNQNFAPGAIVELGLGTVYYGEHVQSGMALKILSGGLDSGTAVRSGGTEIVSSGGTAIDLTVSSGGTTIVAVGGTFIVQSGATNSGTLINSATVDVQSGTLTLGGTTSNTGTLFADGSGTLIKIVGVVSGGTTEIGNGTVDIAGASKENVNFLSNDSGILQLNSAATYTGKVSNFGFGTSAHNGHNEQIDLTAIAYSAGVVSETYSGSTASGVLKVVSGATTVATIGMTGAYVTSNFHLGSGSGGSGTVITDPSGVIVQSADLALFGNYIAGSFVNAAGWQGGTVVSVTAQGDQPLLAHPHA
jgi:autotransporter passenger strand-loop-strand repeat protein